MRERDIEAYLVDEVAKRGGVAEKFTSPNRRSVPDRLVQWPCAWDDREVGAQKWRPARMHFVECKATGEKPTVPQHRDHERRRKMGFTVVVVDSYEAVDKYLEVYGP
jgi:hypothetical protein